MIESLQKTRADFQRACDRNDDEEVARLSGKLCAMLAQEIMMAFGGVSIADSVVILAACKLTAIFVKDAGKNSGFPLKRWKQGRTNLRSLRTKESQEYWPQCPHARRSTAMTKDLLIIGAVVALVAIMILAALPEITSAMPEVYYVEPTEPETAVEAKAETVLQSTASVRYALTAAERDEIERVVMAEAGAEPYIGQMAVAQCILNACEQEDKRPLEIVRSFGYTAARPEPSDEVKKAVAKVFDDGETATDREILYFYAPALCQSLWHESQTYVCTIGGHRFFEEAEQ